MPSFRTRKVCPECSSVRITPRINTHDYVCARCGWRGREYRTVELPHSDNGGALRADVLPCH